MKRALNTLVGRLTLMQLLIHAVLTPLLMYRLDTVARKNAIDAFTSHARSYARSLAVELDVGDILDSPSRTVMFLDGSVEGGTCLYSAIEFNHRLLGSSVSETPDDVQQRGDDVVFGKSADSVYAVSMPIVRGGISGTIYLGFDERPTLEQLRNARMQTMLALLGYAAAAWAVAIVFARLVSRPLKQLKTASRRIASGDQSARLGTSSTMVEIVDLSRDLEYMRGELVGSAARLHAEMQRREVEQAERAALEHQLRHEQRLATVGTFAGGLAHEFNNILVPLLLYTEETLDQIGPLHPARANLERVVAAAIRASDVIAKMLSFSRPQHDQSPQFFEIATETAEALDLSEALIPAHIVVKREMGAQGAQVLGDATLWHQVVLNLCSNAVHAMRENGTLTVKLAFGDSAGATDGRRVVQLRVGDTGIGMSRQLQERIFEPFFTTRDIGQGAGLGLSVVHGIVASMGATIRVVSSLESGSEFIVELPVIFNHSGDA